MRYYQRIKNQKIGIVFDVKNWVFLKLGTFSDNASFIKYDPGLKLKTMPFCCTASTYIAVLLQECTR